MIQRRVLVGKVGPPLVTAASRWCEALGADLGLADADRLRLALCVEELTTNLAAHGGASCEGGPARWSAEVDDRELRLELLDRCPPFDPLAFERVPVPASLADLQVGGHGIHLLREFSDGSRYEFRDGCNRITLTFALERPAREPGRPDALGEVAIFRDVPDAAVDAALGPLTIQDVADDLVLLERGEVNRSVLLVLEGAVRVYLDRPEGEDFIGVGVGECVGEMSVIDDLPVSAHVHAMKGSRLLVIDADTFLDRVLAVPTVARNLISAQAERMRRSDRVAVVRMREHLEMEQARREMDIARSIQASLLPADPLFPDDERLDCVGRMRPAREVGGDLYDLVLLDDRRLMLIIADVCGKGLPAALFMVRAMAALRARPQAVSDDHVRDVMAALNDQLCEHNPAKQFMTAFCGVLDLETYRLRYVNAGHNPPLLSVGGGPFAYLREPVSPPLGMVPGLNYRTGDVRLGPGSRLLLYTDGVTEAEDRSARMLGEERLAARLAGLVGATSSDLVDAVFAEVQTFADGARQSDDITVLAIGCVAGSAPAVQAQP